MRRRRHTEGRAWLAARVPITWADATEPAAADLAIMCPLRHRLRHSCAHQREICRAARRPTMALTARLALNVPVARRPVETHQNIVHATRSVVEPRAGVIWKVWHGWWWRAWRCGRWRRRCGRRCGRWRRRWRIACAASAAHRAAAEALRDALRFGAGHCKQHTALQRSPIAAALRTAVGGWRRRRRWLRWQWRARWCLEYADVGNERSGSRRGTLAVAPRAGGVAAAMEPESTEGFAAWCLESSAACGLKTAVCALRCRGSAVEEGVILIDSIRVRVAQHSEGL